MRTTKELNRKELQNKISNLYNNYTIAFKESIPNNEIEDILKKNTNNLFIVYESMEKTIDSFLKNN
jgi:hypothetical protein